MAQELVYQFDDIPSTNSINANFGTGFDADATAIAGRNDDITTAINLPTKFNFNKSAKKVLAEAEARVTRRLDSNKLDKQKPANTTTAFVEYTHALPIIESTPIEENERRSLDSVNTTPKSYSHKLIPPFMHGMVTTIIIVSVALLIAAIVYRKMYSWVTTARIYITAALVTAASLFVAIQFIKRNKNSNTTE